MKRVHLGALGFKDSAHIQLKRWRCCVRHELYSALLVTLSRVGQQGVHSQNLSLSVLLGPVVS